VRLNSNKAETLHSAKILTNRFPDRFEFILFDSAKVYDHIKYRNFDMIFIDGGHLDHHVMADIKLAQDLEIPWLIFDDWLPQFGPGVQPSIAKYPLEVLEIIGNIAICKWKPI
jgi:hypothetical protein